MLGISIGLNFLVFLCHDGVIENLVLFVVDWFWFGSMFMVRFGAWCVFGFWL